MSVRESIKQDWETFKIYPIDWIDNVDPTQYRFNCMGIIAMGEKYGSQAGHLWNKKGYSGYDRKSKRLYANLVAVDGTKVKVYCDELVEKHKEISNCK